MDFLTDEKLINCSAESTGVYIRLMCILHKMDEYGVLSLSPRDKRVENNVVNFASKLARQMPYDTDCISRSLLELAAEGVIVIEGDRLYQKRMMRDNDLSIKRSEAGRKGGLHMQNRSQRHSAVCEDEPSVPVTTAKPNLVDERFAEFWDAYPRKSAKGSARKAWLKISPSQHLFEKIMEALEAAKKCEQWKKEKGQYIPYPATWLNQMRWEDDYGAVEVGAHSDFDPNDPFKDWSNYMQSR